MNTGSLRPARAWLFVLGGGILAWGVEPVAAQDVRGPHALVTEAQAAASGTQGHGAVAPLTEIAPLLAALGFDMLMPILRDEGIAYAAGIRLEMFPDRAGAQWEAALRQIYDPARLASVMAQEVAARLPAAQIAPILAFFATDLGERIVLLEVTAREAMLEPSVEDAARQRAEEIAKAGGARAGLIDAFILANDLIEMNVAGALNANLAFYRGLASGGAPGGTMTEDGMLAEVWQQEGAIRTETAAWMRAYASLAYQPLSDDDLRAYVDFSLTPEGRALNGALFGAFDALFTQVSYDVGATAARLMVGQDI